MSPTNAATRATRTHIPRRALFWAAVVIVLVFFLFPPIWLVLTSLKTYKDAFAMPPVLFFRPTFASYLQILTDGKFVWYAVHSTIVAFGSTVVSLLVGTPAAYALAKMRFRGSRDLSLFILGSRIAPPIMTLFPLYLIFFHVHLLDNLLALIITYVAVELSLVIWMLATFFEDVPDEIREAALVDGASEVGAFLRIMLPLIRSGLAATAILSLIQAWNEFLFALVLTASNSSTLPVGITSFLTFQGTEWGPLTAAGTLVMIPMLIFGLLVQKPLVRGMTLGAVK